MELVYKGYTGVEQPARIVDDRVLFKLYRPNDVYSPSVEVFFNNMWQHMGYMDTIGYRVYIK